jgi:hypothetical protein
VPREEYLRVHAKISRILAPAMEVSDDVIASSHLISSHHDGVITHRACSPAMEAAEAAQAAEREWESDAGGAAGMDGSQVLS